MALYKGLNRNAAALADIAELRDERIGELEAEVERLREALRRKRYAMVYMSHLWGCYCDKFCKEAEDFLGRPINIEQEGDSDE